MRISESAALSMRAALTIALRSTLLFAATDTTSHVMAQVLQLLAENPEVQKKLRKEILDSGSGQYIPYDQLHSLPYLDAVCKETLRLCAFPAVLSHHLS